jgi:hypothetical protein
MTKEDRDIHRKQTIGRGPTNGLNWVESCLCRYRYQASECEH